MYILYVAALLKHLNLFCVHTNLVHIKIISLPPRQNHCIHYTYFTHYGQNFLLLVVNFGRMTLALGLVLLRIKQLKFGGYSRKARLCDKNLSIPQSQCQNSSGELGGVGDSDKLRCLHGKVDITISFF